MIGDAGNRGWRVWPAIRKELDFPRRGKPLRVCHGQKNPRVIDVDPVAAGRIEHGGGGMVRIRVNEMIVIIVMQQHLPLIRKLCVSRLRVIHCRRQVDRGLVEWRI